MIVTESEALARAGADARVAAGETATFARGADALVVIVEAGDRRHGCAVDNATTLRLRGPFPEPVERWLRAPSYFAADGPPDPPAPPMYAFARLPDGCVALGPVRQSVSEYQERSLVDGRYEFAGPLPPEVLDRVRPVAPASSPGLGWLTTAEHDKVAATREFIAGWHAGVPHRRRSAPAVRVPRPLGEFYAAAAGRPEVLGRQNRIVEPGSLEPPDEHGRTMIAVENQGVWSVWADLTEPDPQVWYDGIAEDWLPERERLSGWLLHFTLSEAALCAPFTGWAQLTADEMRHFAGTLRPAPLRPVRFPSDLTRHYVAPGVVVQASEHEDGVVVFAGARHRSALRPWRSPGFTWEDFDG